MSSSPPVAPGRTCGQRSPAWISLPPRPSGVSTGRCFARSKLTSYDPDFGDDVVLVVSELVTNSVRAIEASHCAVQGVIRLGVQCATQWVHLCVQDTCPQLPARRDAADTDVNGRGLQIVEAYALWWVDGHGLDKSVHALMPVSGMVLTQGDLDRLAADL